jgi:uncharacterized protein (DUF488 family)
MRTSNFRLAGYKREAVAISRGVPRGWYGRRYMALAPTRAMLQLINTEFDKAYAEMLSRLDPLKVMNDLGQDAILLCWEQPGEKCHRRQVAEWLENSLGIFVPEWIAQLQ